MPTNSSGAIITQAIEPGDSLVIRRYYNSQTNKWIKAETTLKDAILFELLLNILNELKRK